MTKAAEMSSQFEILSKKFVVYAALGQSMMALGQHNSAKYNSMMAHGQLIVCIYMTKIPMYDNLIKETKQYKQIATRNELG